MQFGIIRLRYPCYSSSRSASFSQRDLVGIQAPPPCAFKRIEVEIDMSDRSSMYERSVVGTSEEMESAIISGSMSIPEILIRLGRHGCQDITNQLDLSKFGRAAVSTGGFGDVYYGALQDGTRVGAKCLRLLIGVDDQDLKKQLKRAARELYVWSKCKHPNILELFGVAQYGERVAMVSPWMENGNIS
ncbi:unnamed protein product [Rhizoctonia solani]|uniref:Protein kinase domain-containing protein n=1 Tax=Rhizoctonia solani TaxID=456999 RepID=A0A8H2WQ34_9AGAM|nr:unnamed protein product [Rhizoctonia solani]